MVAPEDILIIGAGPAGLSCAIEANKAGMSAVVLDKGGIVDAIQQFQRDMFFFSTPELLEIGGVPFVVSTTRPTAGDCVNYYRRVTEHFNLKCSFFEKVISVEKGGAIFTITTERGSSYQARAVVAATGYYDTPNPLSVPGEQLPHVSHYYRDAFPYFRREVLIVGGKNSAVEAALDLWRNGAGVTMVHRGDTLSGNVKYWILPDFENRVAQGSIAMYFRTTVKEFQPGCTILQDADGKERPVKTDQAFILIGYRPNVAFLASLGIVMNPDTLEPSHSPESMETNIPGLYVAGGMVGGKFNNKVFIENGREHGKKIIRAILNSRPR